MTRRYHTTGCGSPHIIAPGYRYESNPNARLERPAGEPPIWLGTLLVAGTLALIVATGLFLNAVFGG